MAKNPNSVDTKKRPVAAGAEDATMVRPSAGASTAVSAPEEPTTLLFAISFENGSEPGSLTWASDVPVVSMLADLVAASSGSAGAEQEGLLAATTANSLQAVILASRAQKLAEVYSQYPNATLRCLSIAVFSPAKNSAASDSTALRTYLKASNRSGQVLLAGGTYKQLEAVPGFQMRRVPVSSGQKLELHELVLPTVDRPGQTAARTRSQSKTPTAVTQPPVFNPMAEAKTTIIQTGQTTAQRGSTGETASLSHRKEDEGGGGGSKKIVFGAIAALLLVGAGVAVKMSGSSHAPAPAAVTVPANEGTAPAAGTVVPAAAAPTTKSAESAAPAPASAREKKAAAAAALKAAKPAVDLPEEPKPQVQVKPQAKEQVVKEDPPPPPSHGGGGRFNADEIRAILDRADTLAANGKYDEAIRNYNVVLQSDPGNGRAREGRARAIANKSM